MRSLTLLAALLIGLASCGGSETHGDAAEPQPTVLEPLTETIDRARGVQQTVDSEAAELRRRLEEAER